MPAITIFSPVLIGNHVGIKRRLVLERDAVSETFELGDEARGLLIAIDAGVVVAALAVDGP